MNLIIFLKTFDQIKEIQNLKKHTKSQPMATLLEHRARVKKLTPDRMQKDLFKFIKSIEKNLVDRNIRQIKIESKDINGNAIGFYSYWTEVLSNGEKKQGQPFTGEDTGDWMRGFFLEIKDDRFRLFSKDPKTHAILDSDAWLSDDLFGLTDKDLKEVIRQNILPFFIKNIRENLGI